MLFNKPIFSYLLLTFQIVPSTLKRQTRAETARPRPAATRGGEARTRGAEDRDAYRRAPGGAGDKKADVGAGNAEMQFVSITYNSNNLLT